MKNGKGKEYYKDDRIKYEGDFINDKYEGNGKYIFEDGEYYIGEFLNGIGKGKGTHYYKDNYVQYDGEFDNK